VESGSEVKLRIWKGWEADGAAELKAAELSGPLTWPQRGACGAETGVGARLSIWGSRWLEEWLLETVTKAWQVGPDTVYF
jgi:hypothetical protein